MPYEQRTLLHVLELQVRERSDQDGLVFNGQLTGRSVGTGAGGRPR